MVRKPGKHQRSIKRGQDLCCTVHDPAHLLFCAHTLCMNYVIAVFPLVSCMNPHNHLLYFVRFCAGSTPKTANKNIQQRTLPGFLTISLVCSIQRQRVWLAGIIVLPIWEKILLGMCPVELRATKQNP